MPPGEKCGFLKLARFCLICPKHQFLSFLVASGQRMPRLILRPPGPRGRHFLRSPLLGGAGPLVNLRAMARRYGDVAFWQFLHISTYFFSHPDDGEAILVTIQRRLTQEMAAEVSTPLTEQ